MTTSLKNNLADRWQGRRYICLVRQSDDSQGTTSTEAQLDWLKDYGKSLGMVHVDDIVLNGVTGSLPGKRRDLELLLNRKRERDDFDVLLVQRADRLTRGGSNHAFWFEHECDRLGITIRYAGDDMPEDERYSSLIKVAKFEAAKEQARSIGQRSVQGSMHAIAQGRNCVTARTPFGCDRLYLNSMGEPLFIIRNLADGRQQKRDANTGAVIDTFGRAGGGSQGHYRKQKDEQVLIVPGAEDKVEAVRLIFDLHYNKRHGGKRIADLLNRRGILSPTGRGWSQRQVESIYENPIYCGLALGQRASQGIYYRRGDHQPEAVNLDRKVLANCQAAPRFLRPPDDWCWQEQPRMRDFLPADLRDKALPLIKQLHLTRWERNQDLARPKRSTSKHKTSEYILTGLLVAQQDGGELTGVLCGRVGSKRRYYRHRRGRVNYRKGSVFNKMVLAEPLEQAVLQLVREVIADAPDIRRRVVEAIEAQAPTTQVEGEIEKLKRERDALKQRVQLIVQALDEASLADAKAVLDNLSEQRQELERQIAEMQQSIAYTAEDPEALADRVLERLGQFGVDTDDVSATAKRELLEAFVDRVEVDMATKDVTVDLRLPLWGLKNGDSPMRLAHSSASQTSYETHHGMTIHLAYADCRYTHRRGSTTVPPCYRCRRRTAA